MYIFVDEHFLFKNVVYWRRQPSQSFEKQQIASLKCLPICFAFTSYALMIKYRIVLHR